MCESFKESDIENHGLQQNKKKSHLRNCNNSVLIPKGAVTPCGTCPNIFLVLPVHNVWAIKSDLNINWSEGVLFDVETGSSWSTAAAKVRGCCQQLQLLPSVCQKENWASRTGVGRTVGQGRKVGVRPSLVCAGCVLWHSIPENPLPQPSRQSLNISLKYQCRWFFFTMNQIFLWSHIPWLFMNHIRMPRTGVWGKNKSWLILTLTVCVGKLDVCFKCNFN